jgi:hypothetical protein
MPCGPGHVLTFCLMKWGLRRASLYAQSGRVHAAAAAAIEDRCRALELSKHRDKLGPEQAAHSRLPSPLVL